MEPLPLPPSYAPIGAPHYGLPVDLGRSILAGAALLFVALLCLQAPPAAGADTRPRGRLALSPAGRS
jgi:hypothetical protein